MRTLLLSLLVAALAVALTAPAVAKPALEKPLVAKGVMVRADEVEPNDDCASANALTEAMNGEITAEDQDWFEFTATAGTRVVFETSVQGENPSMDTKLYLYADDCSTELAYNDDGGEGYFSLIAFDFDTGGTYYVVVTGYSGSTTGLYTLTATVEDIPEPQPNDLCEGAIDMADVGETYFEVDLCLFENDYSPASGGCTGYTANGPDAIYSMDLVAGDEIFVSMDVVEGYADLAIYLVTDCADIDGSCVAGDDSGNPEEIVYTAEADGTYFLVLDTYSGCCLVGVTTNETVATEGASWSEIKDLYR